MSNIDGDINKSWLGVVFDVTDCRHGQSHVNWNVSHCIFSWLHILLSFQPGVWIYDWIEIHLYRCLRDTVGATRPFLDTVALLPLCIGSSLLPYHVNVVLFEYSNISVPKDYCDKSQLSVYTRPLLSWSPWLDWVWLRRVPLQMDQYGVWDGDQSLVYRNRSKFISVDRKVPTTHDRGNDMSYFVTQDFRDLLL